MPSDRDMWELVMPDVDKPKEFATQVIQAMQNQPEWERWLICCAALLSFCFRLFERSTCSKATQHSQLPWLCCIGFSATPSCLLFSGPQALPCGNRGAALLLMPCLGLCLVGGTPPRQLCYQPQLQRATAKHSFAAKSAKGESWAVLCCVDGGIKKSSCWCASNSCTCYWYVTLWFFLLCCVDVFMLGGGWLAAHKSLTQICTTGFDVSDRRGDKEWSQQIQDLDQNLPNGQPWMADKILLQRCSKTVGANSAWWYSLVVSHGVYHGTTAGTSQTNQPRIASHSQCHFQNLPQLYRARTVMNAATGTWQLRRLIIRILTVQTSKSCFKFG